MRYVVEQYSYWMVVALVIGLTTGWVAARQPGAVRTFGYVQIYVLLVAVGWGVMYAGIVRAVAGLWFETFVLMATAFLVGCIVAGVLAPQAVPKTTPNP